MTIRGRLTVFAAGAVGLVLLWAALCVRLPGPAELRDRYLVAITTRTFAERNVTDTITAVNFDYRGFDTVGEEFILFASVVGASVLLRQAEERKTKELPDAATPGRDVGPSDAMRLWVLAMVGPKVAFGVYVVIHGQLSPGGGFQGGVVLASAALVVYLGHNFHTYKRVLAHPLVEAAEAVGAGLFIVFGAFAWVRGKPFLTDVLPLGKSLTLTSGGTIPLISAAIGLEVAAGFVLLLYAFLQETLTVEEDQ